MSETKEPCTNGNWEICTHIEVVIFFAGMCKPLTADSLQSTLVPIRLGVYACFFFVY